MGKKEKIVIRRKCNYIVVFMSLLVTLVLYLYPFYGMLATIFLLRLMRRLKRSYVFQSGTLTIRNFLFTKLVYSYDEVVFVVNKHKHKYLLKNKYGRKIYKFKSLAELESVKAVFMHQVLIYKLENILLKHKKREESKEPKVCNIEDYWNSEPVEYVEQMEFGETWEFADINTGLSAEYKDSIE